MTVLPEVEAEIRRLVLRDGWKIETTARRFGRIVAAMGSRSTKRTSEAFDRCA
jgi:hypothetical protein